MLYNSIDFMYFFPIVLLVNFLIPPRGRCLWLLITSYYFYMCWNVKYIFLIVILTVITYLSGLLIQRERDRQNCIVKKRVVLSLTIVTMLCVLGYYKYFAFLVDNINFVIQKMGITAIDRPYNIILPMGISFYTFQALGYLIDIYRGDIRAEKNFIRYALFISFFPKLVSGPIEHSGGFLKQIKEIDKVSLFDLKMISNGVILMTWGYFLKMVVADRVIILVDTVFNNYFMYGNVELCVAAVGFALQIYCDFASYSAIAIGAAKIMGFSLMENFNAPYFALNIKDFWRRWHISLSSWLRDYVYIPLGGSRNGKTSIIHFK